MLRRPPSPETTRLPPGGEPPLHPRLASDPTPCAPVSWVQSSFRSPLEKACEEVDAAVFSSNMLLDEARREMLKMYMGRWTRATQEHAAGEEKHTGE